MGYSPCIVANFGHFQNAVIFRILGVFWSGFLHTTTLMRTYNRFSHLFGIFNFGPKLSILHGPCIVSHFQNGHFSNIRCFLERFFDITTLMRTTIVFRTFLAFLILDPNWAFCLGYSPCIVANFGHFQNAVIFRILGVFWSGFLHITTLMRTYNRFSHLFGIFNFGPKLSILHGL